MVARSEELPKQQDDDEEFGDTMVLDSKAKATDNVGMASVEIDVESLVQEMEAEAPEGVDSSGRVRKRLEAMLERKRRHEELMDFEDYDLDS